MFYKNERKKCTENIFKIHFNISDKYLNIFNIFCQTSKGSWKIGYSWVMWFLFLLCSFPGGLGLVHNRRVLQGSSWVGQDFHTYPHPGKMPVLARDVMVNVVNSLGLKLLAIHNENNDDNIAISPYGALSILIALGEGLQGDAVREIQKAAYIPNDISLIRIGLRDIHRHLKSYFIPPEGFLAGLTLNHENVTLKSKYEDILQFYGFDIMSFNNALYPSPPTTQYPIASTTDEITKTTIPMETTKLQQTTTESFTTSATESITLTPISTTTLLPQTIPPTVTTEFPMNDFTEKVPETTTSSTTIQDILSTTETPVLTTESMSTTESNIKTTEEILSITSEESISTEVPTTILSTTTSSIPSTTPFTSKDIVITSAETTTEEIATNEPTTTTDIVTITTEITTNIPTTEAIIATTNPTETTEITAPETDTAETTIKVQSTTEIKPTESRVIEEITVEVKPTEPSVTGQSIETTVSETSTTETTTVEAAASEAGPTEAVTLDSTTTEETLLESTTDSEIETTSLLSFPYPDASTPEAEVTTENQVVTDDTENIVKRKSRSMVELIKLNTSIEKTDVAKPLSLYSSRNRRRSFKRAYKESNKKPISRKARSVIDYMIARYYDNYQYHPLHNNQGIPYVPQTKPSFLVQGKYREYQVQFMKYDTVLPFFYVSHLNALALSFPLDSPQYYLLLLLPVQEDGVDQLICELRLNGSFKYIIDNLIYRHVTAVIPSFLLKGYVNLTPTFQKLGIRRVFEPRQADFSPMTNLKDIYITNIEQAITVNIKNYMEPAPFGESRQFHQEAPIEFRADHPFVYFVVDAEFHVVLMTGKVVNPLNTRIT